MRLISTRLIGRLAFFTGAAVSLMNVPAQAQPGIPSTATPLAPTTIIQDTAIPALPPSLEQDARSQIAALRGISNDAYNDYWSRGQILAYMLLHVLEVAQKQPSQYTPEDQEIANYFNVWIYAENAQIATLAANLYNSFSSNPCGFSLPQGIGNDNGQDYLQEDGVTSFCTNPIPFPILGTFVYTPVPPASQFWSWAQAMVLNQHLNAWGNRLFNPYANYYDPSGNVSISTSIYGPSTAGQAAAVEYFGALQSIDEGTAFLVNQYAQIPSSGASQAATNFQDLAYLDAGIDLLDHGLREIISSDISTASEEVLTIAEAEDAAALGVDLAPELSELALQGVDLGVGPVLIAAAITALNLQQIIGDSSVGSDLTNMTKCALFVGCGSTPAQLSDFAQTVPNGRQMILQALVRAVMPSYSVVRYADPVYGAPPSAGPVLPFDQKFVVNGTTQNTFYYTDWNGNTFNASVVGGWLVRQLTYQSPTSPVTIPQGLQYAPGIEYQAANQERWFAWLSGGSFLAQRAAVQLTSSGLTIECPGSFLAPNGTNVGNQCVLVGNSVQVQAGDQISIGGQVNSVTQVYLQSGIQYIQPTYPFPNSSGLQVLLLAQPTGELMGQPLTNCMNSSSLDINGSPRTGVSGPDCTQGGITTFGGGPVSVVLPPARFDLSSLRGNQTEYFGDPPFSVASLPFWSSPSNGAVTFSLGAGSAGCSVTSDGTVSITGLGTCQITASQVATNVFPAEGPITSKFVITAGQPAMDIVAPAILSGNSAVVIVAVYGAGGGTVTGSVSLSLDGATVGTQAVSGGFAEFTVSKPTLGNHTLQANFTGNPAGEFLANSALGSLEVDPNFGTVAAGGTPPVRVITFTFTGSTLVSAINIVTEGVSGLDYTEYGGDTCRVGTSYTTSQSCTVNVQFKPAVAGARPGAVMLFAEGTTKPLFTVYLNGTGQAGAVTIDPGAETQLNSFPDQQGVALDGEGNWFIVNGTQVTEPSHNDAVVISGLPSPKAVVVDGAGNVYVSDSKNNNVIMVPNENGKLNSADQTVVISGIGTPTGLAVDVNGNLYVSDSTTGNVWQVPAGTTTSVPILTGLNAPQAVAVDAKLNIYVSTSDNLVTEYPVGYKPGGSIQPVAIGSGYVNPQGLAVDASGTVYVADTGNVQIVKVAPGGASQSILPFGGTQFGIYPSGPQSIALDSANNLYVIDPSAGLVKISRTQPPSLVFFAVVNTNSPTQTLTVSDAGNQQLTILSASLPANFVTKPSGGTDCAAGTPLSSGGQCVFDVAFSPTPGGNLTGSMVLTENGVGSTTQSVALSGTVLQAQTINFTTPPPAQTANDVTGAFNVAATASSGLPITFTSSGVCTNFETLYLMTGATGTCSVIATQAGNATYGPVSRNTGDDRPDGFPRLFHQPSAS